MSATVAVDDEPVSSRNVFLFHKNTRRAVYDERLGRHAGADDVLLINERGEVTESTVANRSGEDRRPLAHAAARLRLPARDLPGAASWRRRR